MLKTSRIRRTLAAATLCASMLAATAAHADFHFDFSQANSLASYSEVSFANAVYADILNANFDVIGQHWIVDSSAPAVTIEAMSTYGYNGSAAPGATGLQALWQPVLMQFAAPVRISAFSLAQDNSSFGSPFNVSLKFLDADGMQIGNSVDYLQNAVTTISSGPVTGSVSSVLLPSGKFYTGINAQVTPVPEPSTWALMAGGLLMLGAIARRRSA